MLEENQPPQSTSYVWMNQRFNLLKQCANHLGVGELNVQGSFRLSDDNVPVVWNNFVGIGTEFP